MNFKKLFYNTVLSQTFSSCGDYLFTGNTFGDVFVYSVPNILSVSEQDVDARKADLRSALEPIQVFQASAQHHVHSLAFHRDFLIVGTTGMIFGYAWTNNKLGKLMWSVKIPASQEALDFADVNYMWVDVAEDLLYAGCGDNIIYGISLDNGQIIRTYNGHKDYIHCLHGHATKLYSASEDGLINMWDRRTKRITGSLEPHTHANLERPHFGKWQGAVSASDDWLVCGGGPKASLWHLRSLECTTVFPFPNKIHVASFVDDAILVAGHHNHLFQFNFKGDVTAEMPVSPSAIYSVAWQMQPHKIMAIAGTSNGIDICTNFHYKDTTLKMYKK